MIVQLKTFLNNIVSKVGGITQIIKFAILLLVMVVLYYICKDSILSCYYDHKTLSKPELTVEKPIPKTDYSSDIYWANNIINTTSIESVKTCLDQNHNGKNPEWIVCVYDMNIVENKK